MTEKYETIKYLKNIKQNNMTQAVRRKIVGSDV